MATLTTALQDATGKASRLCRRAWSRVADCSRVGYIGYLGYGNLGDEAMFEGVKQALPGARLFYYRHPDRERPLARLGLSGARFFQSALLGGGTLIGPGYVDTVELAIEQGLPLWSLGTGVGSPGFEVESSVELGPWATLLPRFAHISVRGPLSAERLATLGVTRVDVTGDPAFLLARSSLEPTADPPRVLLNVAQPERPDRTDAWNASMAALAEALRELAAANWLIEPVAMQARDVADTAEVLAAAGVRAAPWLARDSDSFFRRAAPCTFAITVRLHAGILAACAGVPPVVLGYRDKCLDFCRSIGIYDHHVDLQCAPPEAVRETVERVRAAAERSRPEILQRANERRRAILDFVRRAQPGLARR